VELHALDRMPPVAKTHDLAVLRPCGDLEVSRETRFEDHQRVIAGRLEAGGKTPEDPAAVVGDGGRLAVHLSARAGDRPPEGLPDGLVAQADAQDRHPGVKALDQPERDAGPVGVAGPGRDHDRLRGERLHVVDRERVVARHAHGGAELAHVLHEVVGERVVVVEDQDHWADS
jgi:hypothetical protein